MKTLFRIFLASCLFATLTLARDEAETASFEAKAVIVCDDPTFDFGEHENNGYVDHDYVIRNDGNITLEIRNINSSCGCTVASPSKRQLAPGETAIINARFDLRGRSGRQIKTITVQSNDPDNPVLKLQLMGNAIQEIHVNPTGVFLGRISANESRSSSVEISSSRHEFQITGVRTSEKYITANVVEGDDPKLKKIEITLTPPLTEGRVSANVFVDTDIPTSAVLIIPVAAYVTQ